VSITINGTTGITQPAVNLAGSSSGIVTVQPAAAAGTWTMTLPTTAGTNGYVLGTDGTGVTNWVATAGSLPTPTTVGNTIFTTDGTTWSSTQKIVQGTAVATTSGTSFDFTSIPSWVKRITVMFQNVSLSGTANILLQLGTGGTPTTTGYLSGSSSIGSATPSSTSATNGIPLLLGYAPASVSGSIIFTNLSSNIWTAFGVFGYGSVTGTVTSGGHISLGGTMNILRITTTSGTDTFDAGSVNILYE
jgi:hypothetical protein